MALGWFQWRSRIMLCKGKRTLPIRSSTPMPVDTTALYLAFLVLESVDVGSGEHVARSETTRPLGRHIAKQVLPAW